MVFYTGMEDPAPKPIKARRLPKRQSGVPAVIDWEQEFPEEGNNLNLCTGSLFRKLVASGKFDEAIEFASAEGWPESMVCCFQQRIAAYGEYQALANALPGLLTSDNLHAAKQILRHVCINGGREIILPAYAEAMANNFGPRADSWGKV